MEKYYNCPCVLWKDYLLEEKREQVEENVISYLMAVKYDVCKDMNQVRKELGNIVGGDDEEILRNGHNLIKMYGGGKTAHFSVAIETFWDFKNNYHTDEERAMLLAYLAIKSIVGKQDFIKTNAQMWLSRMDGNTKPIKKEQLTNNVREWSTPYKIRKLKALMWKYYHVGFYSSNVHGFYASIKLTSAKLIQAVKKEDNKCENLMNEYKSYHSGIKEKGETTPKQEGIEKIRSPEAEQLPF